MVTGTFYLCGCMVCTQSSSKYSLCLFACPEHFIIFGEVRFHKSVRTELKLRNRNHTRSSLHEFQPDASQDARKAFVFVSLLDLKTHHVRGMERRHSHPLKRHMLCVLLPGCLGLSGRCDKIWEREEAQNTGASASVRGKGLCPGFGHDFWKESKTVQWWVTCEQRPWREAARAGGGHNLELVLKHSVLSFLYPSANMTCISFKCQNRKNLSLGVRQAGRLRPFSVFFSVLIYLCLKSLENSTFNNSC